MLGESWCKELVILSISKTLLHLLAFSFGFETIWTDPACRYAFYRRCPLFVRHTHRHRQNTAPFSNPSHPVFITVPTTRDDPRSHIFRDKLIQTYHLSGDQPIRSTTTHHRHSPVHSPAAEWRPTPLYAESTLLSDT